MKFSDDFLNDLRERLKPSEVLGRHYTLVKRGVEMVAKEDQSISVNDQKRIWKDFGKSGNGGDIFDFYVQVEGLDFVEAVKRCADMASMPLPKDDYRPAQPQKAKEDPKPKDGKKKQKREIVATYDYTDAHGMLLYQVVRFEPKGFGQRRPYLPEPGRWVWGLDAGEFMRKGSGSDWSRYDEEKFVAWNYAERKEIGSNVEHGLYKLPELLEAIDDGEVVFLVEGEKDVHTFERWDLVATTNSGGAKHWGPSHAEVFIGADVVIPIDNDEAGHDRAHILAASLKGRAKRIRILDFAQFWTGMPLKADVTDWRDAGGTREQLEDILTKIPEWTPAPPRSVFGAVRFIDLDAPAREYEPLVKGLLTRGESSILAGAPGSGKSFEALDIAFSVSRAALDPDFLHNGRRVRGGLVLYQAGEGGLGVRKRLRAYRSYHGIPGDLNLPFVLMPLELNLHASDDAMKKFIEEGKQWSAFYEMPVELTVIDTFSAATPGANENAAEDMTKVLARGNVIREELRTHVMYVHHFNKAGSVRGWSGLIGNVDSAMEISLSDDYDEETIDGKTVSRQIRVAKVIKQKDAETGAAWKFTLPQVIVGKDIDGDPITSCVVRALGVMEVPAARAVRGKSTGFMLNDMRVGVFRALLDALEAVGEVPPPELKLPASVTKVVRLGHHRFAYNKRVVPDPEDAKKNDKTIRSRLKAFREFGQAAGIIGVQATGGEENASAFIWPTGKPVFGRGLVWPPRATVPDDDDNVDLSDEEMDFFR